MKQKEMLILAAMIGLGVMVFIRLPSVSAEDIEITEETHYTNTIIEFNGNLTIKLGGVLYLDNVTLRFNVSKNGEYGIKVLSGGRIIADRTTFTDGILDNDSSTLNNYRYFFIVREGGQLILTNSTVEECGFQSRNIEERGLYVEGEGSLFFNTIFQRNNNSLILSGALNVRVEECIFRASPSGIYAISAEETIVENCNFTDIYFGVVFLGGGSNTIKDSVFLRNLYGLYVSASNGNRFINLETMGVNRNSSLFAMIMINSEDNVIEELEINIADIGLYLSGARGNTFERIITHDLNVSVELNASHNNLISNSSLSGDYDFFLEGNSTENVLVNTPITRLKTDSSTLSYSENYSLKIQVRDEAHYPIEGAEICVMDEAQNNTKTVYATAYFGGSDDATDSTGTIKEIILPYRVYAIDSGNISYVEHNISVSVHYGEWNDTATFFLNSKRTVNFTMPRVDVITVAKDSSGDYTTIQAAIDAASAGNIVFVGAGEYNESLIIDKRIRLRGESNEGKILTQLNGMDDSITIKVITSRVILDSLKINGGHIGIEIKEAAECEIQNLKVIGTESHGILFKGVTHSIVNGTEVWDTGKSGLFLYDRSEYNIINSSIFHHTGANQGGVFISSLSGSSDFNSVIGCEFYHNSVGIVIEDNRETLVHGCNLHDNEVGIGLNLSQRTVVENTSIKGAINLGINMVTTDATVLRNLTLWDNYFAMMDMASNGIILENSSIGNAMSGILLSGTKKSSFSNLSITAQVYGVLMTSGAKQNILCDLAISGASGGIGIENGSKNNTLLDSRVIQCGYGLLFNSGSRNIIQNTTILESGNDDIMMTGNSMENIFYDCVFTTISADQDSTAFFYHFITIRVRNVPGEPLEGIEVRIVSTHDSGEKVTVYATSYYGGSDPVTNENGMVGPVALRYGELVNGTFHQELYATAYLHDTKWDYERELDITNTHVEEIVRDLIPMAEIIFISPNPALKGVDTVSFQGSGWDDTGILAYEWSSDKDGILSGEKDFVRSASTLSIGNHTISFRVKDTTGHWSPYVYAYLVVMRTNTAPYATSVRIDPPSPTGNEDLIVVYDFVDPDGDNETGTLFLWYVDNGDGFLPTNITGPVVGKENLSFGQRWKCQVTPFDGMDYGTPVNSTAVVIKKPEPSSTSTFTGKTVLAVFSLVVMGIAGAFLYQAVFRHSPIEEIFLIYQDGRLIAHETKRLKPMDADVISSMLSAVQDFVRDSFSEEKDATLDRLDFGDLSIVLAGGKFVFIAAVVSEEPEGIRKRLQEAVSEIETRYRDALASWDGTMDSMRDVSKALQDIIDSTSPAGIIKAFFRRKKELMGNKERISESPSAEEPKKERLSSSLESGEFSVGGDESPQDNGMEKKEDSEEDEMEKEEKREKEKERGGGDWDDFDVGTQEGKLHFGD